MHDFVTSCIDYLESICSLNNVDLPNVDIFYYTIIKTLFITSPLIAEVVIRKLSNSQAFTFEKKLAEHSSLNNQNLSLTHSFKKNDVL